MANVRSRLPPSFSVTVGTEPTVRQLTSGYIRRVGKLDRLRSRGLLQRSAQGGEGEAAGFPPDIHQRPPRPPDEASLQPPGLSLRGVAPHGGRTPRDRPPFRRIKCRKPGGV